MTAEPMPATTLTTTPTTISRRTVLTGAAAGAALGAAGFLPTASYAGKAKGKPSARITVLGTTDLHGNVFNWDYFANREYDDRAGNDIGLAKISTLVAALRGERGTARTLLVDAGDTIQGTPLAYYYARIEPITDGHIHPMAAAMNQIGYDAAALGNHEFNYGIDLLRDYQDQLEFPLLGANAVDVHSNQPAFPPYSLHTMQMPTGPRLTVGILGLTNPGIAIWDKANVEGKMAFPGLEEQAAVWVPRMRRAGADIVIVSAHSGADTSSSWGDALPYVENASTLLAQQVPGIDAILVGHAHVEIAQRLVTNTRTGKEVLLTEPLRWGMRLSVIDLDVVLTEGRWVVAQKSSHVLNANAVVEDPAIVALLQADHDTVKAYVNSVIGTSLQTMSAQTAVYEDTAAMDFINYVQADAVKQALAGTADAARPVLAIAAPFNRSAVIPEGDVSVRDVAGMYIYDNTLLGVKMTGAQIKDYLEYSARYFQQVSGAGPFPESEVIRAKYDGTAPNGTPDYNYDILGGLDADLTYDIDIAQALGSRIENLSYAGTPVDPAATFVVAVNNYRQSGGGSFPHVKTAEVVYNRQVEIRQLIIDWVTANGVIDAALFSSKDWQLVSGGQPITVTG